MKIITSLPFGLGYVCTGIIGYVCTGKIRYVCTGKIRYVCTGKIRYVCTGITKLLHITMHAKVTKLTKWLMVSFYRVVCEA